MSRNFLERTEIIEECYEFMLAYAAQGLADDQASKAGGQLRDLLDRSVKALAGIAETCEFEASEKCRAFLAVLDRDARDSAAAIELVLAQPSISSQLIDNLNASIHLRALLTDLFLLGEILRKRVTEPSTAEVQGSAA
jgi:hypothetical protein